MFAFQVSRKWPHLINSPTLKPCIGPIIRMLENYPYMNGLAHQLRQMMCHPSYGLNATAEEPLDNIPDLTLQNESMRQANELIFDIGETDTIDCEGLDWFFASGYLANGSFLEQNYS